MPRQTGSRQPLEELSFYLGRAYYHNLGLLERTLADLELDGPLRPGMGHVLFALFERDDCIMRDILERVQLSPSTLTGMVDAMVRTGVAERRRDPEDGRAVRIRLTPAGRALRPRCRQVLRRITSVLRRGLGRDGEERLKRGLAHLVATMRQEEARARRAADSGDRS